VHASRVRSLSLAVLACFAGAAAALLGVAWDVSIHSAYPTLAAHETLIDPLSPAHDLIAVGIVVAAVAGAWAIGRAFGAKLGAAASLPITLSMAWIIVTVASAPALPNGTVQEQAAAASLWQTTKDATARYSSLAAARADGYIAFNPPGDRLVHYINPAYMRADGILDPYHIESLVYENTVQGPVLVAAMYSLKDPTAAPPDIAGPLTPWHRHDDLCFTPSGEVVGAAPACPGGSAASLTPWMLHVWLVPNRYGRFAADFDPWNEVAVELFG